MSAPRTLDLTLDGADQLSIAPLWAWQSNPLTLDCALSSVLTLLAGTATLEARIHLTAVPAGTTPLAAKSAPVGDGANWDFDFTTAEMAFSIGANVVSAFRYLFITALDAGGNELQTLYARRIEIKATSWSDSVPDVTPASSIVRLVSATPDADGLHTFTALGKAWRLALSDFDDA